MSINIISTGSYTTDEVLDNEALSKMVDTNDKWILERTGIKTRHIASNMTTEELASKACEQAIKDVNINKEDIGLLVFATISSDTKVPSSSYTLAGQIGLEDAVCFDVNAACSGFIYSMTVAKSMMNDMNCKYALVVGAERLSKFVDWTDRSTCILFGDGAACALLENSEYRNDLQEENSRYQEKKLKGLGIESDNEEGKTSIEFSNKSIRLEIKDTILGGTYDKKKYLKVESKDKVTDEVSSFIEMNGRQIYKFATEVGVKVIDELLQKNDISSEDIVMVIPHQANKRIIQTLAEKSNLGIEKWFINLDKYGNTSSASVPIALDEALKDVDFKKNRGKYLLTLAFGGGLSYGGILFSIK